jgi:hypothetical protein
MICQGEINGLSGGDQWSVRGQTMEAEVAVGVR